MRYLLKNSSTVTRGDRVYDPVTKRYYAVTRVNLLPEADYYGDRLQLWMRDKHGEFCREVDPDQIISCVHPDQRSAR